MLQHYAITGQVNTWIQSFLDNRRQTVVAEIASSGSVCVEPGVPQGSVLSPFLFSIHINDLQKDLSLPTIHSVTRTPLVHMNKQLCNKTWTALLTGKEMAHVIPSFPHQQKEEPVLPPVPPSWPPSKIYQRVLVPGSLTLRRPSLGFGGGGLHKLILKLKKTLFLHCLCFKITNAP